MVNLKKSVKRFSTLSDSQGISSKTSGLHSKAEQELGLDFFVKGYS
jgi:hypothetical protein